MDARFEIKIIDEETGDIIDTRPVAGSPIDAQRVVAALLLSETDVAQVEDRRDGTFRTFKLINSGRHIAEVR